MTIPGDYETIQDAVNDIPQILRHRYILDVDIGYDASTEDVYVPPTVSPRKTILESGETTALRIFGTDKTDIGSIMVDGVTGMGLRISDFNFTGSNPNTNEDSAVGIYGCGGRVQISNCTFDDAADAVMGVTSYSSNTTFTDCDLGTGLTTGGQSKHGGKIMAQELTGSVEVGLRNNGGVLAHLQNSPNLSYSNADVVSDRGPAHSDAETGDMLVSGVDGPRADWRVRQANVATRFVAQQDAVSVQNGELDLSGSFGRTFARVSSGDGTDLQTINTADDGQIVILLFADNVTVVDQGGNLILDGRTNVTLSQNSTLSLIKREDVGLLHEIGRMVA